MELPGGSGLSVSLSCTESQHEPSSAMVRSRKLSLFTESKPGTKGPRKATVEIREKVLALRARNRSVVTEIADELTSQGVPISAQTVW